jgi:hypothetical protein
MIMRWILLCLFFSWLPLHSSHAVIDEITLELTPPDLLLTGGFVDTQWSVKQSNNPQPFELTFFREGPPGCGTNQSLLTGLAAQAVSSGPHVVALCDGDRVLNKIFVIGREITNSVLVPGTPTLEIISDTVPPDPPNIDDVSNDFPKTVFTSTFQILGNVNNSNPAGNATDKPEISGSVTVFIDGPPDPVSGASTRQVLGGGLIQPNSRFIGTVDMTTLVIGQTVKLRIVASDSLGHESAIKDLGDVTRGQGGNVSVVNQQLVPSPDSITRHSGVLIAGQVLGTVGPFSVKFFVDGFLNSEIAGLTSGDNFSHSLNMNAEGLHCFALVPENSNNPIFKGPRIELGCIELDLTPPTAPQILLPNPEQILVTKGPEITIEALAEPDKNLVNTLKPKVYLSGPSGINFAPLSPLEITTSGRFSVRAEIQNLPDGQHTIELKSEDEVGNTGPGSIARVAFIKDTISPIVEEVRLNEVPVPQLSPPIFLASSSVRLKIRLNEDAVKAPILVVRPFQDSQFNAGLFSGSGKIWEYSFALSQGQDGPLGITVKKGEDQAGNPINFTLDAIAQVDTVAPSIRDLLPAERSVLSKTPEKFRLIFEDILSSSQGQASGVDTLSASIRIFDPNNIEINLNLVEFDPITVDAIPQSLFELEGDYKIEVVISDKAGNRSLKDTRLFTMDFSAITPDLIACRPENNGFARFGAGSFPQGGTHFVEVSVSSEQFDINPSSLVLKNFQEIPQILPGQRKPISDSTLRYELSSALPSDSSKDGKYVIESQIFDRSGNETRDHICVFTYDNCNPSVEQIFPQDGSTVSKNFRITSAILKDCLPRFDVEISDIDLSSSSIRLFRDPNGSQEEVRSKIRFESIPEQRAQKLLLEIVDESGAASSLPNDGSADGLYRVEVMAVDKAGNQSLVSSSTFSLDTQDPILIADNLENDMVLAGGKVFLFGKARDNSGGSGLQAVEIKVEALQGLIPTTTLLAFTPTFLAGATLPPNNPEPPFQDWNIELDLPLTQDVNGQITLRAIDQAGNYRDFSYRVRLLANSFGIPVKSAPVNNATTNRFFVSFSWAPVDEAAGYELEILTPNQNRKTFKPQGTSTKLTLNLASLAEGEGVYAWNLRALDSLGNRGNPTLNTIFKIDQTAPQVTSIQIQDPSPESQGHITQGITRFILTFSEPLDESRLPDVFLQPVQPTNSEPQTLQVLSLQANQLVAQSQIKPPELDEKILHGLVRIQVEKAWDAAGNPLREVDSGLNLFEVSAGPFFDVKFFSNPVDHESLTFIVKGFETPGGRSLDIPDLPSVLLLDSSDQEIALNPVRLTASAFSLSFHLLLVHQANFHLRVTGEDRFGNISSRSFFIPISKVFPSKNTTLSSSRLKVEIPEQALLNHPSLMLLPPALQTLPQADELELVEALPSHPYPLELSSPGMISGTWAKKPSSKTKPGLYVFLENHWEFMGNPVSEREDGKKWKSQSRALGPMAFYVDQQPPKIEVLEPRKTGSLRFSLSDSGSGVDFANSNFQVSGSPFSGKKIPGTHQIEFSFPPSLSGKTGYLLAQDRAGNIRRSTSIATPIQRKTLNAALYPNPAKTLVNLRIHTNIQAQRVEMYVYDSRGDRVYQDSIEPVGLSETVEWDLISENGNQVSNGVYFMRVKALIQGQRLVKTLKFAVLQ